MSGGGMACQAMIESLHKPSPGIGPACLARSPRVCLAVLELASVACLVPQAAAPGHFGDCLPRL